MLIDSHCHIPHEKYDISVASLIDEALKEEVAKFIAIGTSLEESLLTIETTKQHAVVFCTIGVYPHENQSTSLSVIYEDLKNLLDHHKNKIVGIGECGIDKTDYESNRKLPDQLELFKLQIGLALGYDLPLVIHNRNGDDEILRTLEKYKNTGLKGVIHCFSSNWDFAQKILDLGFYLSFAGMITYPSVSKDLLDVVEKVPQDRFLVETDSPYLPPQSHRGKTNYPKYVKITAEKIAQIRKSSFSEVAHQTYDNTCRLFNLPT